MFALLDSIAINPIASSVGLILFLGPLAPALLLPIKLDHESFGQKRGTSIVRIPFVRRMPYIRMKIWHALTVYLAIYVAGITLAARQGLLLWMFIIATVGACLGEFVSTRISRLSRSRMAPERRAQPDRAHTAGEVGFGYMDNATAEEIWVRCIPLVAYFLIRNIPDRLLYGKVLDLTDINYVLLTALVYGCMHVPRRGWLTGVRTFFLGCGYSLIAVRCGLFASVVAHASFNLSMGGGLILPLMDESRWKRWLAKYLKMQRIFGSFIYYGSLILAALVVIQLILALIPMKGLW